MKNPDKNNDYIIEIKNVSKSFTIFHESTDSLREYISNPLKFFRSGKEKFTVLRDIDLKIKRGEFVALIGSNGSGKSTLLKIIAGIYAPDRGRVIVNGSLVPFLELGVGFNPQLTVKENVFLNGTILGMTTKFLKKKFDEIIGFAELEKFIDTPVKNLSSGMKVRLAFAIAIQTKADIYLLDEILAVGDFAFRQKSMAKMNELLSGGATVLYVSHSLPQVNQVATRAVFLKDGILVADGNPKQVIEEYKLSYMNEDERAKYFEVKAKLAEENLSQDLIPEEISAAKLGEILPLNADIGSGKTKIAHIRLLDSKGKETTKLKRGEDFAIEAEVIANNNIINPVVHAEFRYNLKEGLLVMHTGKNTDTKLRNFERGKKYKVRFQGRMILTPKTYHLLVQVIDENNNRTSLIRSAIEVEVIDSSENYLPGLIEHKFTSNLISS